MQRSTTMPNRPLYYGVLIVTLSCLSGAGCAMENRPIAETTATGASPALNSMRNRPVAEAAVTESRPVSPVLTPSAMTAAHNTWRSQIGVPALRWSDSLARSSQQWADHLAGNNCRMQHSTHGGDYGENLYWVGPITSSDGNAAVQAFTAQKVVDSWGSENKYYDYEDNSCHSVCGHYTQVVWKSTTEVGCAVAVCGNKGQIWVCQYTPSGNMAGQRPY
ncbi:MAG: CAP domain-containing protein [Candidatus Electrothrix sp. YB6]